MKTRKEVATMGAQARWRERYNALIELTKVYPIKEYKKHEFSKWKTKHLLVLVSWIRNND